MNLGEDFKAPHWSFEVTCIDLDGNVKWRETIKNLVMTLGKNDVLDKYFAGSAYTAAFKMGLKGTGTALVADTLASHGSWTEVTPYAGNRPALSWGAAAAGSKSASQVSYSITGPATVAGIFITDQASGTSGLLYSAADFTNPRSVDTPDTLNVTPTVSCT